MCRDRKTYCLFPAIFYPVVLAGFPAHSASLLGGGSGRDQIAVRAIVMHPPQINHCGDLAHKVTVRYNFVELELVQFRTFGKGSSRSTAAKPIER
jgi:hypothetical protein